MPDSRQKSPFLDGFIENSLLAILENARLAGHGQSLDGTVEAVDPGTLERSDPARIKEQLDRILVSPHPDIALIYLKLSQFLKFYIPDIDALTEFDDGSREYKDLWDHTLKVVSQTPPKQVLRWSALLHDIGKLRTKRSNDKGEIHFIGHDTVGARMSEKILKRLRFPADEEGRISFLIRNHLRCSQYESSWTDSAVRRLGKELGEHFEDLIELSRADITTKRHRRREKYLKLLDELDSRLAEIRREDDRPPLLPSGLGDHIMKALNLAPGPEVGRIRNRLLELVKEGTLPAGEPCEYYINYLNSVDNADNNEARSENPEGTKNERKT
jgi:poly(A) polymerase